MVDTKKCIKASFNYGSKYNEAMRDAEALSSISDPEEFDTLRYNAGKSFLDLVYILGDYKQACENNIDKTGLINYGNKFKTIQNIDDLKKINLMEMWQDLSNGILP